MGLCIGFLEYISVGKGIEAADLISKNTDIDILLAAPNCPGRYQVLFTGDVGAVNEAVELARGSADFNFLDSLVLPRVDDRVVSALYAPDTTEIGDAIGVFETMTMTAVIEGADTMVKASSVQIVELRLGKGLAGKSYVIVTGSVQDVQTAIDSAKEGVEDRGVLISAVVIPSINPELVRHLI
ncbi:MAG: BMC domain-containing protein [Candidatus Latescibacterota bacterium]